MKKLSTEPSSPEPLHNLPMNRKPLKSSKLRAAGYDEGLRVMEIEFVNGDVYEYKEIGRAHV